LVITLSTLLGASVLTTRDLHAADPTVAECLAASHASLQTEAAHKLRAERAQLLVCAADSCPKDIRKDCVSRVDEVTARIPTIIFAAKDGSGADLSDVKVTMDAELVVAKLEGLAIAVDPGSHAFTFETPGQPAVSKTFVVQVGQHDRRESVTFASSAPPAPAQSSASAPAPEPPPAVDAGGGLGTQKILALVAGGIGVVGVGVGTVFGLMAISKKTDAQNACPGECATQDGVNKWNDMLATGNISTIGFVVGGVGLVGGAVLWLTAPGAQGGPRAQVGFGPGALQVRGTW
jgi:hypothetical protein